MTSRNHHYISQFYLKDFTGGNSKNSKLSVIDFKQKKYFETIPRNVAAIRDFNRVEVVDIDPNIIEKSISEFEANAAIALKKIEKDFLFEGSSRDYIFNLIALFAVRTPVKRDAWSNFQTEIAERIMELSLETKDIWESQTNQMNQDSGNKLISATYEDVKKFFNAKNYKIKTSTARHIELEFSGISAILPFLYARDWVLIKSNAESGPFITTDNPVSISWLHPNNTRPAHLNSPGFAMLGTRVYFPLSKNLALIGDFESDTGVISANQHVIANLNSMAFHNVNN